MNPLDDDPLAAQAQPLADRDCAAFGQPVFSWRADTFDTILGAR